MKSMTHFLQELGDHGIKLWVEDGNLRFRAPQGALTAELRATLTAHKAELLALLSAAGRDAQLPAIVPAPQDRHLPFPLTDIQQAYWVGRELDGVSTHLYLEIEQRGFEPARIERAWQQLVARHDMLRAIVLPSGEQQILVETPPYQIAVEDLRAWDEDATAAQLETIRQRMSHQKFRAEEWPLFEVRITQLDSECIRLHISIDILMVDMGSYLLLFQEWVRLYQDPSTVLKPLALSFRDCVLAEKAIEQSDLYRRSQEYWRQRLDTLPASPELPLLTNAKASHSHFVRQSIRLAPAHWQQIQQHAAQAGLTPSAVLLTAFAEVLNTWSRTSHFTLNLTLLNRLPLHPQINEVVGDFTSVFLLEVDHREPASFLERAGRLQRQLWQDLDHRYVSGVWVQRELARRQGGAPQAANPYVFTSGLGMTAFDLTDAGLSNFGETIHHITQTSQVWLDHQVFERSDGSLFYSWDVAVGLFPPGLLDEIFTAYSNLLQRLATDDALWASISAAPVRQLVPAAQLAQRQALNATAQPVPAGLLHTLFAAKAAAAPNHPAVITVRRTLSYREVDERSNQIAHRLRALGVGPDQLVAVVMEKGWEQIVAVYGILKAGGAYTPIDANFPDERIALLLDDSQATVVLTQSLVKLRVQWPAQVPVLAVDDDTFAAEPMTPITSIQEPHHLAYVLYTSGSTGKPKGVMIEHRNVINRMSDIATRFALRPEDRALGLTALHHDLSVFDIFGMLSIVGGAVVLPTAKLTRDPAHWVDLMVAHGVTLWNSVPAFMQMLVAYLEEAPPQQAAALALRWTIWAGDFIPVTLPDRLRALVPAVEIIASGGPTETTVWDIYYRVGRVDPAWNSIPYGKPLANARYYVLNDNLEERPDWVAGELYIGGVGLARGYWRDEARTAAAFITHPETGERLYRSGDMGRYVPAPAGELPTIEILGRKDFQIKIRGHRIEPGEIETILEQHPLVKRAVVTAIGDRYNKQLVAYAVTGAEVVDHGTTSQPAANGAHTTGQIFNGKTNGHPANEHNGQTHNGTPTNGFDAKAAERAAFKFKKAGWRIIAPETPAIDLNGNGDTVGAPRADYVRRQSYRTYQPTVITRAQIQAFLSYLSPIEIEGAPLPKYLYGSGGSLYPVQAYLYVKAGRIADIPAGLYYYHPGQRKLWLLMPGEVVNVDQYFGVNQEPFGEAAFALYLIGKRSAVAPLYGELARDFCLLEAGYISQLLMMQAPQHSLGLCPIGGVNDPAKLLTQLELDSEDHFFVHSLIGGVITPEQMTALPVETTAASAGAPPDMATPERLRTYLQRHLPAYMVPKHIVLLDALPLSANGKIDRKSLPDPEIIAQEEERYVTPERAMEEQLTTIVQNVLALESLSATSNFFDLGANSVHMVLVCNQLQKQFDPDLSVVELFQYPTIRALATYLEKRLGSDTDQRPTDEQIAQAHDGQSRASGQTRGASRRAARQRQRLTG